MNHDDRRYWDREAARLAEDVATDAAIAQSAEGIRIALHRATQLPSNEQDARHIASLQERLVLAEQAEDATFDAETAAFAALWTRDVTIARRAAWNDAVRALPKGHGPAAVIARLGFSPADLKRAVALYNL